MRQHKRRIDVVQRSLSHRLNERELRIDERCRDSGLFDPDQAIARADYGILAYAVCDSDSGSEIKLMKLAARMRKAVPAKKIKLLSRKIEDRSLIVDFGRRKVERIS